MGPYVLHEVHDKVCFAPEVLRWAEVALDAEF